MSYLKTLCTMTFGRIFAKCAMLIALKAAPAEFSDLGIPAHFGVVLSSSFHIDMILARPKAGKEIEGS
ncbi:hypothetical protein Y032_0035g3109 [Ancylostoma ceylanicum]|uniref:Uncharacterized protein n=1 Tax=Ancylostoma ceylanicum TaxID=53326 RepID=A0A016UNK1_9BILA|nr:hypothetical protein Y032_0035g3109 [Ancylostoma ceylanicum]